MENEKLHSRLEQQSNLICMLKQRNDKTLKELSEATSKYESSCQQVESLQQSLADESRQRKLIEQRFSILAKNHEEMIRFKDEYKGRAQALERELVSGQRERAVGQERTLQLQEEVGKVERVCQEKMGNAERRCTLVAEQRDLAEKRLGQLETNLQVSTREQEGVLQHMQSSLTALQEENSGGREQCRGKDVRVKQLESQLCVLQQDGRLLTSQLQHAVEKAATLEQELASMKAREVERAYKVSRDAAVMALKKELEGSRHSLVSLQKEYEAYKTHCTQLLAHERKLNQQLRHLLE